MTNIEWSNKWANSPEFIDKVNREYEAQFNNPTPTDPRDSWNEDKCIQEWQKLQTALSSAKEAEMEMRKYVVKRAFPKPDEGINNKDLGNGYKLKAGIKFNYKLDNDNDKIWNALDTIAKIGNEGSFIAERLISWTPNFLLTEYRALQENNTEQSKQILNIINSVLTITDAAPTLEVKEPKVKK